MPRTKPTALRQGHHQSKKQRKDQMRIEQAIAGSGKNLSNIAPAYLSAPAKRIYSFLVDSFGSLGILKPADRYTVQQIAIIINRMRKLDRFIKRNGQLLTRANGSLYVNPACKEKSNLIRQYKSLAVELGLTPSSRSRLASLSDVKATLHQDDVNNDPVLKILTANNSDIKQDMKRSEKSKTF